MSLIDRVQNAWRELTTDSTKPISTQNDSAPMAYQNIFTVSYTGEKNLGEMGPIIDYRPDYDALRFRSWQSYLESEITQTVLKKFVIWIIGSGLKIQCEPSKKVLESEKISLKSEEFNEVVEARFSVFAKSVHADYSGMRSLHRAAKRAFRDAIIGGDVLVVLRYIDKQVKVQLIDGAHVGSPMIGNAFWSKAKESGNTIRHGVEISPTGEHVAFFVKKGLFDYERIAAKGSASGLTMAFLVYGLEYRLDSVRGLPLISAMLETIKKLERYKEATVGSAEERQKIPYTIVHGLGSTGESPLQKQMAKAFNVGADSTKDIPVDVQGKQLADTIAVTTNKQVFNMPIDSKMEVHESKGELHFKDFYTVNIDLVCAALGIPPEIAMSKYNSNFSASRAALKDWEHTINVTRDDFSSEFYSKIYTFWLEIEILKNKIQAPGYLAAKDEKNYIILDAYRNARFVGANVPHIDPLKEVNAERAKLGKSGENIPLTTVEAATEALNGGDSDQNMLQYADELKESIKLGIGVQKEKLPKQEK